MVGVRSKNETEKQWFGVVVGVRGLEAQGSIEIEDRVLQSGGDGC
jgi:hypothetical protein